MRESARPVLEVMEWPLYYKDEPGETLSRCPTAPYRIAAYVRALTGSQPFTLRARVALGSASLTSAGARVTAAGSGTYSVIVRDATRRDGFRMSGAGFSRRTTARFLGTVKWRVRLQSWDTVTYGRLRGRQTDVPILTGGRSLELRRKTPGQTPAQIRPPRASTYRGRAPIGAPRLGAAAPPYRTTTFASAVIVSSQ